LAKSIIDLNFCAMSSRSATDIEKLYLWCKEGWQKSVLGEYKDRKEALSRFAIGAVLQSEAVLSVLRRELKKLSPDVKVDPDEIQAVLVNEVLKREVVEGDLAAEARKRLAKIAARKARDSVRESALAAVAPAETAGT